MKNLLPLLLFSTFLFYSCEQKEPQQPIDLGINKSEVLSSKEDKGTATVQVSNERIDISKFQAAGSKVTFEQTGNVVAMRMNNSVTGEFSCDCLSTPTPSNSAGGGSCRVVIIGNFINCQNNGGCTGNCSMTVVINDLKLMKKFW